MDADDLEPRKRKPELKNLDPLSIDELREYIAELRREIERVEANIAAKSAHKNAVESLFKNQ